MAVIRVRDRHGNVSAFVQTLVQKVSDAPTTATVLGHTRPLVANVHDTHGLTFGRGLFMPSR